MSQACPPGAADTAFYRKSGRTSFGRTETIDGTALYTLVDADLNESVPYTLYIDTKQVTQGVDPVNAPFLVPNVRVVAVVEVGSANGVSRNVYDATDLLAIPIAGDHVRVAVTLEDPTSIPSPSSASSASPIFLPNFGNPALPTITTNQARAQVTAFMSAGAKGFGTQPDQFAFVPSSVNDPGNTAGGLASVGVVSSAPCRLMGFQAMNPSGAALFLYLVSNPATTIPTIIGPSPFIPPGIQRGVYELPAGVTLSPMLPGSIPFDRGLAWGVSADPAKFSPSATKIRFDATLLRRPIVQVVNFIPRATGQ